MRLPIVCHESCCSCTSSSHFSTRAGAWCHGGDRAEGSQWSSQQTAMVRSTPHHHDESNWMNAAQARARRRLKFRVDLRRKKQPHAHTQAQTWYTQTHTVVTNEDHVKQACLPLPPPPLPLPPLLTPPHSVRHLRLCCSDYLRPISAAPILTYSH